MLIKVRVTVDARTEKVVKKADDLYVVSVREPAERNMANRRVLQIIKELKIGRSVRLVSGQRKTSKIVEVK